MKSELEEAKAAGFAEADTEDDQYIDMFDENEELKDDGSTNDSGKAAEDEWADPHEGDEVLPEAGGEVDETELTNEMVQAAQADGDTETGYEDDAGDSEDGEAEEGDEEFPELLLTSMGMDESEAKESFGTPQAMADQLRRFDTNMINQVRREAPAIEHTAAEEKQEEQFDIESIIPEDWDDSVKDTFRKMSEVFDKKMEARDQRIAAQEEALQKQRQREEAVSNQRYVDEFDEFIDNLGDDWKGAFGTGKTQNLNEKTVAYQNRVLLEETSGQLSVALARQGLPVPSSTELRIRALHSMFPQENRHQIERKTVEKVEQRQRQFTHRPTGRRSKSITGELRAIKRAEDLFEKRGMPVDRFEEEIDEI
jgi:hypothetical protein